MKGKISLLIMAAVLPVILAACGGEEGPTATSVLPTPTSAPPTPAPTTPPSAEEGWNLRLIPAEFTFQVGRKVRLKLTAQFHFHTFTAKNMPTAEGQEINVIVGSGDTTVIEFTPSQAGTFGLICRPHEALGMVGTIIVNP